jgi:hypothetical protein
MRLRIGTFGAAAQYLHLLEKVVDEWGGSIQITGDGVYYEAPHRLVHLEQLPPLPLELEKKFEEKRLAS